MIFTSQPKQISREETIFKPYREAFGSFPSDGQYWTLCAKCYDDGLIPESEYAQAMSLIKPHQFYGVDIDGDAIRANRSLNGNFFLGDFYSVMSRYEDFRPSVVNLDCLRTFEAEKLNIKRVFLLLHEHNNFLFNFNVLLQNYRVKPRDPNEIFSFLMGDREIARRIGGWNCSARVYPYRGIGVGTVMFSVTLIKR